MHTGRCEAFAWGKVDNGPFTEYDWRNSYPSIAASIRVPTRFVATVTSPDSRSIAKLRKRYAILADVSVYTETPCVPATDNGRVCWPVGRFETTLWDSELALIEEANGSYTVTTAYLYHKEPALQSWAEWILKSLNDPASTMEPWQKLILKHWSRTLIGRFGMRYKSWEHFAVAPDSRIYISELLMPDRSRKAELMQIGTDVFISGQETDVDDACPQITSYIMSEARARLWRAMQTIGLSNVLYVDTDSIIVGRAGHGEIQRQGQSGVFSGLRSKGQFKTLHLYGPRAYRADSRPVASGLARDAIQTADHEWRANSWMGAKESVRLAQHDRVTITVKPFTMTYNSNRRYLNGDGTTLPYWLPGRKPFGTIIEKPSRPKRLKANDYPAMHAHNSARAQCNRNTAAARATRNNMR